MGGGIVGVLNEILGEGVWLELSETNPKGTNFRKNSIIDLMIFFIYINIYNIMIFFNQKGRKSCQKWSKSCM